MAIGRNSWVAKERTHYIESPNVAKQRRIHNKLRQQNAEIERDFRLAKKQWAFLPSPMTVLMKDTGVVLNVPQELGRVLIHRRLAGIIEHDGVIVDAVIEYSDLSEAFVALGLATEAEAG